jgi:hypothetical protein
MGETFVAPVVRELESLQHIVPDNNDANEDENADIFNNDIPDDGIGKQLSQGVMVDMQLSTRREQEDMARPITPVVT